jgi:hypothetical protein
MKKVIVAASLMLLCATSVLAAGSCAEAISTVDGGEKLKKKLTLTCTHAAGALSDPISTANINRLAGMWVYSGKAYPGGTAPTDASDLTIVATKTGTNKSIDILGANGVDALDATSTTTFLPEADIPYALDGEDVYTVTSANNAVAAAVVVIELILVK